MYQKNGRFFDTFQGGTMMKIKDFLNKTLIRAFCQSKEQINQSRLVQIKEKDDSLKHATLEKGRSMIEILGVLATIGVLSVGGMMGYRFAMDKYHANDILNSVNMRAVDTINLYQNKTLPDIIDSWGNTTNSGFPVEIVTVPEADAFHIYVDKVSSSVCKQVVNLN